jgi:hypothetical protein
MSNELKFWALVTTLAFPLVYAFVILWAVKYRFRSTLRHLLIATTLIALSMGLISAAVSVLNR